MSDEKYYTAILDGGTFEESTELEFVDGLPQNTLVRDGDVDGVAVEVTWELDPDADGYVYRPLTIDGAAE
jgi:hypothetical protein